MYKNTYTGRGKEGGGGVNPLRNYCPKIIRGMMRRCRMICSLNLKKYFHEERDIDGSSCSDDNVMNACWLVPGYSQFLPTRCLCHHVVAKVHSNRRCDVFLPDLYTWHSSRLAVWVHKYLQRSMVFVFTGSTKMSHAKNFSIRLHFGSTSKPMRRLAAPF
jgi:hypothetical protein